MAQVRIRKRGKTFSFIFEAGKVDGKRKVVEKGGFPTKDAAYKAGVEAYNDYLHGNIGITSEKVTLREFIESWLKNVASVNVRATTMQGYSSYAKKQILPTLGDYAVQDLTPAILDKWIRQLQQRGYSKGMLNNTYAVLSQVLDYAVYPAQLINSNPAKYIKIPKNAPRNIVKRTIISPEQFVALLEQFPFGTSYHMPLMLMYYTGMRISEALGLSWSDIDFSAKRITLRRQLLQISKRGFFLSPLKTEASNRYIIISDALISKLKRWRAEQFSNEAQRGDSYVCLYLEEGGHLIRQSKIFGAAGERVKLVCTHPNGQLLNKATLGVKLRELGLNAHSFRHTHATQLIQHGAAAKAVASRLGHANVLITQNLYTHNTLSLQQEVAAIFDEFLQTKV